MTSRIERFVVAAGVGLGLAAPLGACGGDKAPAAGPPSSAVVAGPPVPASAAPAATSPAPAAAPNSNDPLTRLAWLVGTWVGTTPAGLAIEEKWSAPEGSVMKGESKATQDGKSASTQQMTIEVRPDAVVFVATRSGQKAADFPFNDKASGPSVAFFMNLDHDWPTRIRYERVGDDLKVKVQGRPGQQVDEYTLKLSR